MDTRDDTGIQRQKDTEGHKSWYKDIVTQGYILRPDMIQGYGHTMIHRETRDNTRI